MTTPLPGVPYYGPGIDDATAAMIVRNTASQAATTTIASNGPGTNNWLIAYADEDNLQFSSVVYDGNSIISTASVIWPDGTTGLWTTTSATAQGYLIYTVTYLGSTTKTVTCTVTRNTNGQATNVSRSVG